MKKFYLLAIALLGAAYSTAHAQLPQKHGYQKTLTRYMGTLKKDDFVVPLQPLTVKRSYFHSVDDMYRAWLFFGYKQYDMVRTKGLRADPSIFTLNKIQAGGQVNMDTGKAGFMSPMATAFWSMWDYKGNPHYGSRAVKLRAFVASAVDMMMQDQDFEEGHHKRSDFLGGQLIRWAFTYGAVKDILPDKVKKAYEHELLIMFEHIEKWGPVGVHADMDMRAIVGMLYTAKFIPGHNLTQRAHNYIDLLLKRFLAAPGYIDHGKGYDAGYNGISLYFINWGAQMSGYKPLIDALKKMSKFKAYMTLPDPDGVRLGEFQTSPSSPGGTPHDQWSPYNRDVGIAGFSDDAAYLVFKGGRETIHGESTMLREMNGVLKYFNGGKHKSWGHFTIPNPKTPRKWKHRHWFAAHDMNPTALYYKKGLYNRFKSFKDSHSALTNPPFLQKGTFTKDFADKYLIVKRASYGTIINNDRLAYWTDKGQTKTLNGFGGGNLAAFWTPQTGSVLLGGIRTSHQGGLDLDQWRIWPVHTLSGETADGKSFSSGLQRFPKAKYELNGPTKQVTVNGGLAGIYPDPRNGLTGDPSYKRVFKVKDNGVEVTTSLQADGGNRVKELYEILPVFRRNAARQKRTRPTTIDFKVNGSWQKAGTAFKKVTNIRLKRFKGTVYIDFKNPRRVKLSPHDFYRVPDNKSGMQARNIMIDLLGTDGKPVKMSNKSVSYFMRSSKAAPNKNWDDEGGGAPPKDTTPPVIDLSHSPDKPNNSQKITITAKASDDSGIKQMQIFVRGEKVISCGNTGSCKVSVGAYKDGSYKYYATATDVNGNKAKSGSSDFTVKTTADAKDTTPPAINLSHSPDKPNNSQKITITAKASDDSGIKRMQIFVGGEKVKSCGNTGSCKVSVGPYKDGSYKYYATATDVNGNKAKSGDPEFTVKTTVDAKDTTPPKISLDHNPSQPNIKNKVTLSATATDESGIKDISLFVGDKKIKTCNDSQKCSFEAGPFKKGVHKYHATATDVSGNTAKSEEGKFTVITTDNIPPEIQTSFSPNNPGENEKITFNSSADDDSGIEIISMYLNGKLQKECKMTSECSFDKKSLAAGSYKFYAKATDNSTNSNTIKSNTKTVTVKKAAVNASPSSVEVSLKQVSKFLTSKVSHVSDPDGDKVNLNYDWRVNGKSIALINLPFDVKISSAEQAEVSDYSSNNNDAVTSGTSIPAYTKDGKFGGAFIFDGKNDYVKIRADKALKQLTHFTVDMWIKPKTGGKGWKTIITKPFTKDSKDKSLAVFSLSRNAASGKLKFQIMTANNKPVSLQSKKKIPAGKWTHVAGSYNGQDLKLFTNGELDQKKGVDKPLANESKSDVFIGINATHAPNTSPYNGALDEVEVFNRAITKEQIKQDYLGNRNKLSLDQTQSGERWEVAVTANDSKVKSKTTVSNSVVTKNEQKKDDPSKTVTISENYPNPFRSSTSIDVDLNKKQKMSVDVYNILGRHVRNIFEGNKSAGHHTMKIEMSGLSSGVYFCRFKMEDKVIVKKMMHLK